MPKAKPKPKPDGVQLRVLVPAPMHDRLRRRAFADRRSIASLVRVMIEAGLKPPKPEASAS